MIEKSYVGKPAQITFTSDFHELLTGDLRPGWPVTLRYDPRRIVPADDPYVFGDPKRPINAHILFREGGPVSIQALTSQVGLLTQPNYDISGQGSMLTATFPVPGDAQRVVIWFSFLASSGNMLSDNDKGANFCFRFPSFDVHILEATVVSDPATSKSSFALSIAVMDAVEDVAVRFRIVGEAEDKQEVKLHKTDQKDQEGRAIWSVSEVTVPFRSTVQFKVFYWIGGTRYKDDNGGRYYLAPQPPGERGLREMREMPKELVEAAKRWKV